MTTTEQVCSAREAGRRRSQEDREIKVLRHLNTLFAGLTLEEQARAVDFLDSRYLRPARKALHAEREAYLAKASAKADEASQRVVDALNKLSNDIARACPPEGCCHHGACEEDRYEPCDQPGPIATGEPLPVDAPEVPEPYFAVPPAPEGGRS